MEVKLTRGKILLALLFFLPVYFLLNFWVAGCGFNRIALPPFYDPCILAAIIAQFPIHHDTITPATIALLLSYILSCIFFSLMKKLKKLKKQ
jgi:hypothetical protein